MQQALKILICTWNTQSVNLSERVGKDCSDGRKLRERFHGWLYAATDPDFLTHVATRVQQEKHHLVVLALQEDTKPGSYAISHAAPAYLSDEYVVVSRARMMGVGVTTWKKLLHERTIQLRGLRLLVMARRDWWRDLDAKATVEVEEAPYYRVTRGKGGLAIRLSLPHYGTICFINAHLPFKSSSLYDDTKRQQALVTQNDAFRYIYKKLAHSVAFNNNERGFLAWLFGTTGGHTKKHRPLNEPLHVFMMGDLNYRVRHIDSHTVLNMYARGETEQLPSLYLDHDELHAQMRDGRIPALCEGVANKGPQFYPTAKLDTTRSVMGSRERLTHYKVGKEEQRVPSWCDRILYTGNEAVRCRRYVRYDAAESVQKSDHASVMGEYVVASC